MTRKDIQAALAHIQARGEPITASRVREIIGHGSYRDIYQGLRELGYLQAPTADDAEETDGPSTDEKTPLAALADDAPVDPVAEAERTLQHAQQRLEALQVELPSHEHAMDVAREAVLNATARQLAAKECRWRGYWPNEDESVLQAITAEVDAKTVAYRDARQAHEQAVQAIAQARQYITACERAVTQARRDAYLQAHHADLLARLDAVRQDDPTQSLDAMHPRYYALQAQWRAQVRQVEAEIAEALQAAGVYTVGRYSRLKRGILQGFSS
jgi:hypothetical protein